MKLKKGQKVRLLVELVSYRPEDKTHNFALKGTEAIVIDVKESQSSFPYMIEFLKSKLRFGAVAEYEIEPVDWFAYEWKRFIDNCMN